MKVCFIYIGAGSGILNIDDRVYIGIDPALNDDKQPIKFKSFSSVRNKSPFVDKDLLKSVQLWFITHEHEDHLDSYGVKAMFSKKVLCNSKAAQKIIDNDNCKIL